MGCCCCSSDEDFNSSLDENNKAMKQDEETKDSNNTNIQPGKCYLQITYDIQKDLLLLKEKYPQYLQLISRKWIDLPNKNQKKANDSTISIMQFNILADGLTGAYTSKQTEKTFLGVDKKCLQFTYRGLRIVEELLTYDPDIICLEECDILPFLMNYLQRKGYASEFQEKTSSPISEVIEEIAQERNGVAPTMPNDGVAIIYKTNKFEKSGNAQKIDMKQNKEKVFGIVVPLRSKSNKNMEFLMVCTHLKSTKDKVGEELRERQINLLLGGLIKNENKLPIVLAADLNANPIPNKNGYDPLCYDAITKKLGFRSCYQLALGSEPEYTTWKLRERGTDKHVLDYIFINEEKWKITGYLDIPKASGELTSLIPNWNYPSDHFSIMFKLSWQS